MPFGIKIHLVIWLASYKELERFSSFSILWKDLCNIDVIRHIKFYALMYV